MDIVFYLRQTVRSLLQARAFTLTALITIALGIGANTAVYTVVHGVLLEPLPFRQSGQLMQIWETHPELHNLQVSIPDYLDWNKAFNTLDIAAYTFQAMDKGTLLGQGEPVAVQATNAASELFPLLGIQPIAGRLYSAGDESARQHVALISEHLWRRKFSADPQVIGRPLQLDAMSFTIVGVLPQRNLFPGWADVWLPLSLADPELYATRKYHPLEVIGRLKPGFTFRQAELETEKTARDLSAAYPATNGKIGAVAVPLLESITGEVRPALLAAWIAVGLVLLIACANLGHLMMSRALRRQRETALRLALGAGRLTVFRTFLVETCLLAITGGVLGIAAAEIALPVIERFAQDQLPRPDAVHLNFAVLLFAIAASAAMSLTFALPSYWHVYRTDLTETISSANARVSGRQSRLSSAMMASEVALAVAVLLAAILLVRSFYLTLQTPPGFQPANVVAVHTPLADRDWAKSYQLFQSRIVAALRDIPGVKQVAAVNSVPMSLQTTEHSRFATRFGIAGMQFEPGRFPTAQIRWCTADYFSVLGIPLLQGRLLTESDYGQPRYLINETFARRFFPHSDPLGQKLLLGVVTPHPEAVEIVGVVGDVREFGLASAPEPAIYDVDVSPEMDVVVKAAKRDGALRDSISAAIRRLNPQHAIGPVRALDSYLAASLARQRFLLALIATFAGLAMCLCGIGVYGVFSYSVRLRMREFGIRSAVGARRPDLIRQVIHESLVIVLPGIAAGLALAAMCSQLMRSLLYRVSPTDVLSSILAGLCILALCLSAVLIPALRAATVDPAVTLRVE